MLDVNCKAHELDNLYVVDTSFFPSIGAVNPALTAMANALRVGEHITAANRTLTGRREARAMARYPDISDHGLIGDLQTAALVTKDGTVDWFCCPRFDSPSVFASLLDADRGGYFKIAPDRDDYVSKQLYLPDSAILVTRFMTPDGVGEVHDFMPVTGGGATDRHRPGAEHPGGPGHDAVRDRDSSRASTTAAPRTSWSTTRTAACSRPTAWP